jgi:8-oxo-dGTP pyrophosphatase MutT (NUDIX family)
MSASWILELRQRLSTPPAARLTPSERRPAAVLVPLFVDAGELWVLLTKRSEILPQHRGQIAFPGGGRELGEDEWAAALRESQEEIGLDPRLVVPLGCLDEATTPSGFTILPCVGAIPAGFQPLANAEIAEVFSLPLAAIADPKLVETRRIRVDGRSRELLVYHVGSRQIWGLTARILANLLERLGLVAPEQRE